MTSLPIQPHGKLADNVAHFARALRAAGLPVGPARVADAVRAVEAAGFSTRADLRAVLRACLVSKREHMAVFDQVFRMFWRDPQFFERMMAALMPQMKDPAPRQKRAAETRAAEALMEGASKAPPPRSMQDGMEVEFDQRLTFSEAEVLAARDFEQMSAEEARRARDAIARLVLPVRPRPSRRTMPAQGGTRPDWRRALRAQMRPGGSVALPTRARRVEWPALVALCDISGSMAGYSRMLLHFLHAMARREGGDGWSAVHGFTFGTRLTNVTRALRRRDADEALALAGQEALDWEGGTRIGESLRAFNRDWSRRVLGQGATVLLITDGLDRGAPEALAAEAKRLSLSCRRLIWLNPLLRFDGFAAKAQGVRALLPHVHEMRAVHNLDSLATLAEALGRPDDGSGRTEARRLLDAA